MRLIDADALYERTAEWEAQAMAQLENLNRIPFDEMEREEYIAWRVWSAILNERSAFKHDVADAPTVDVPDRKVGEWVKNEYNSGWHCSECKEDDFYAYVWNSDVSAYDLQDRYCPSCGAEMFDKDTDVPNKV